MIPFRPLLAVSFFSSGSLCWVDQALKAEWKNWMTVDSTGLSPALAEQRLLVPALAERDLAMPEVQDLVALVPRWELVEWVSLPRLQVQLGLRTMGF